MLTFIINILLTKHRLHWDTYCIGLSCQHDRSPGQGCHRLWQLYIAGHISMQHIALMADGSSATFNIPHCDTEAQHQSLHFPVFFHRPIHRHYWAHMLPSAIAVVNAITNCTLPVESTQEKHILTIRTTPHSCIISWSYLTENTLQIVMAQSISVFYVYINTAQHCA